jgi:hypothetical protein
MSQKEVFKRLFVNEIPESREILERVRVLMSRREFDADCRALHEFYFDQGLDFLFCWASAKERDARRCKEIYYRVVYQHPDLPYLFERDQVREKESWDESD